ncbi:MAG: DHH family phosphoesterase, partial [Deltaproteobacteria bacterium]|nr:DHH family phosphoesterase [Deltaproteobacteria bacterium]
MELIITHDRADFDAVASMLCARKLFPKAVPVLPKTSVFKLKAVLSLYRNVTNFRSIRYLKKLKDLTLDQIIVVDTKKKDKLKDFAPYLGSVGNRLLIFDHHPPTSNDLTWGTLEQFPHGANATGLFFKLMEQDIELTPAEATIIMLGIYADTGKLTYPGTKAEDAIAVGKLLHLGADLQSVNHYLRPFFDPAQRSLFREMLACLQEIDIEGYKVVLVKIRMEMPVQGLSVLLASASDMVGADVILGIFGSHTRPGVQLIIQSLVPEIRAGEICSHFNGGGHAGAAAAFLPHLNMDTVTEALLKIVSETPFPGTKVKDIMTPTVITIPS